VRKGRKVKYKAVDALEVGVVRLVGQAIADFNTKACSVDHDQGEDEDEEDDSDGGEDEYEGDDNDGGEDEDEEDDDDGGEDEDDDVDEEFGQFFPSHHMDEA